MDEKMQQLESYFETLKTHGEKLPSQDAHQVPHFRSISAASGVDFGYLVKGPYRQRVLLAAEELGVTAKEGTLAGMLEAKFIQNQAKLNEYFRWLKANAFKLPEDPTHRGSVFFIQVTVEADLTPFALRLKHKDKERDYNLRLRQSVEKAASDIGIEVRLLPQSPGHKQIPFSYKQLFEKGTEERKKELKDGPSAAAQLYNTRHALNQFLQSLGLEVTAPIGPEFIAGFKRNMEKVIGEISNVHSRKKFKTEIYRWHDIYRRLLKGPFIPDDINQAIIHLVDRSGLSLSILAKLIGMPVESLSAWHRGISTPNLLSVRYLERMESLFKISAGTLVDKISSLRGGQRFRLSELPPLLQQNPGLFRQVGKHLPEHFCTLPREEQEKIVESIRTNILHGDDKYGQRLSILSRLPYRLQEWPDQLRAEFDSFADFKMAEQPPPGMRRYGTWRPTTKKKTEMDFAFLFGAMCLPPDAEDVRLRGLGFPKTQLTLALIACSELINWYIKFRCEVRNQYTEYPAGLLRDFISMLRPETGWLRQSPHLADRLLPFEDDNTCYVSQDFVSRAQSDWYGVCDEAIKKFEESISIILPRATVARNPFHRIKGLLDLDDPMEPLGVLVQEMRRDLPNPHTRPVLYHAGFRDLVITILIVVTGFRRGTIAKLDYTGDETNNLYFKDGQYVLSVPRAFFKNENSSYFKSNRVMEDYRIRLRDVHGLNELFKEYLEVSRPFLMKRHQGGSTEQPLFVVSRRNGHASRKPTTIRLGAEAISQIFMENMERYLVENKHRGTGIRNVKRTGPHSVRHIRGTTIYRRTHSFKLAGDANQQSERTAREHYSRISIEERNNEVNEILFDK